MADISGVHHLVDVRGHDLVLSSNNKNARKRFASIRHARLEAFSRALRTAGARHLILDDRSDVFREFDRFFQLPLHG
ncbi:MAG TPA: hypothetical protein PK765_04500 [bacterium]|nr:hypothetical protein [bacterium]